MLIVPQTQRSLGKPQTEQTSAILYFFPSKRLLIKEKGDSPLKLLFSIILKTPLIINTK
jgi:hypothetical protein